MSAKASLNLEQRREELQRRSIAWSESVNASPLSMVQVTNPTDCPFPLDLDRCLITLGGPVPDPCRDCREQQGQLIKILEEPQLHRIEYDTRDCLKIQNFKRKLDSSGLLPEERLHTLQNASLDKHNRRLYQFLQKWDLQHPLGVYLLAGRSAENPEGNGTGKSYALHALTVFLAEQERSPIYVQTADILAEIRSTYHKSSGSETRILERYRKADVLLLDDMGKEWFKDAAWAGNIFYSLFDYRVRARLPFVIASNLSLAELVERYGESYGSAIFSRLCGNCQQWLLGGPDRRIC